jgi:hypothetical protein
VLALVVLLPLGLPVLPLRTADQLARCVLDGSLAQVWPRIVDLDGASSD